jgi:NAD(P)-dependent dehydrogenase (short-subunit alcohol dehydrogenase family)
MSERLEGRVAIVTGGARNIGRAVGERLAAEGALVALADIDESVTQTASEIGGEAVGYVTDVSSSADVDRLFDDVLDRWGTVDILVNNAARVIGAVRHFLEADEEWWDGILDVNLKGHFLCALRAAKVMAPAGRGVIVNTSSGGATRAHRGMTAYDASKGGIEAFTRAVALDLAPYGIRSVCVVPGFIQQPWQDDQRVAASAATVPLGRMGQPADIAAAVAFLVSDDASYLTAATLAVDGGMLSQQRSPQVESFPVSGFPKV